MKKPHKIDPVYIIIALGFFLLIFCIFSSCSKQYDEIRQEVYSEAWEDGYAVGFDDGILEVRENPYDYFK